MSTSSVFHNSWPQKCSKYLLKKVSVWEGRTFLVSYTKVENREAEFFQKIAGICSFPRTLDKSLKFGKEGKKGQIRSKNEEYYKA